MTNFLQAIQTQSFYFFLWKGCVIMLFRHFSGPLKVQRRCIWELFFGNWDTIYKYTFIIFHRSLSLKKAFRINIRRENLRILLNRKISDPWLSSLWVINDSYMQFTTVTPTVAVNVKTTGTFRQAVGLQMEGKMLFNRAITLRRDPMRDS